MSVLPRKHDELLLQKRLFIASAASNQRICPPSSFMRRSVADTLEIRTAFISLFVDDRSM
jgi:hypothetical protein